MRPLRVAINGFGRIGRLVFRAMAEQGLLGKAIEVVAINDLVEADNLAYLLKYDSTQGRLPFPVHAEGHELVVDGHRIPCIAHRDALKLLPWKAHGVDVVLESTGLFADAELVKGHLEAGAQKVLITAPAKGAVKTIVMGVNDHTLQASDLILSNASCTTNCLAPLAKVLLETCGIEEGLMTTVHSYTATQKTVDSPSRKDWKGGRAAALNIIPSTTGAAKAVGLVLPELQGKLTGMAFRVPTPTVSVVDLTFRSEQPTTYEAICASMQAASQGALKGILDYTTEEVVSSDFIHYTASSIFDAGSGIALNDRFFKLVSWYDNEWGYSYRCVDVLKKLANFL
jgi:glyceraldehyde 3-phosphate dehydrogenase